VGVSKLFNLKYVVPERQTCRFVSLKKKTGSITEEKHSVELSLLEQKEKDLYRYILRVPYITSRIFYPLCFSLYIIRCLVELEHIYNVIISNHNTSYSVDFLDLAHHTVN
jgi:hypothetical protein